MEGIILLAAAIGGVLYLNKIANAPQHPPGLNHSLEHLEKIRDKIAFWPRKTQAKYADEVCKEFIDENDEEFINSLRFWDEKLDFKVLNTTSIGNLAYIALHAKSNLIRAKANMVLEKIKQHEQNKQ